MKKITKAIKSMFCNKNKTLFFEIRNKELTINITVNSEKKACDQNNTQRTSTPSH